MYEGAQRRGAKSIEPRAMESRVARPERALPTGKSEGTENEGKKEKEAEKIP